MRSRLCRTLLVLTACLPGMARSQGWHDEGSITSRQYQNQIREGNTVAATEFYTLQYSVQTWVEDTGLKGGPFLTCSNKCNGKVHKNHEACDFSCDVRCTETHRLTIKGTYTPDRAAMNAATAAANGLARQGGGTTSPDDWSHEVSQALAEFRNRAKKKKTFDMPHAGPCSGRSWWVGTKLYVFHVRGTMTKVGYSMSRGVRTPIKEVVGTHEQAVASLDEVQDEPMDKRDWTWCECKGADAPKFDFKAFIESIHEYFNRDDDETQDETEEEESISTGPKGVIMENKAGEHVDPGDSKFTVLPNDMNSCVVKVENATGQDVNVTIPVGTFFDAVDASAQDMSSTVRTRGWVLAGRIGYLQVSLRPTIQDPTTKEFPVRWACLEMAKHEPRPGAKYVLRAPQDDVLVRLGAIANRERIRGPHDQARTWIYSDKATIDEVNKRMLPGVSEGRFATLLWEVATKGGVDLTTPDRLRCVEPKLLNGVPLDERATTWLVNALAENKPNELAKYVDANGKDLSGLMSADTQYAPGHIAAMVTAMLSQENPAVRKSAVKFLAGVPQSLRGALAEAGGLAGLRSLLSSGSAADVSSAVDVLVAYPNGAATDLLGASWEQFPTDALKARAKKSLGIEG